jgi:hypothetical protein
MDDQGSSQSHVLVSAFPRPSSAHPTSGLVSESQSISGPKLTETVKRSFAQQTVASIAGLSGGTGGSWTLRLDSDFDCGSLVLSAAFSEHSATSFGLFFAQL